MSCQIDETAPVLNTDSPTDISSEWACCGSDSEEPFQEGDIGAHDTTTTSQGGEDTSANTGGNG